jgi:hypothetical protein
VAVDVLISNVALQMWEVESNKDGNRLFIEWGEEMDMFDPATQVG